jgi:hypothetical protein
MWRSEKLFHCWWIQPDNEVARARVAQLDQHIRTRRVNMTHPLLECTTEEEQELSQSLQGASLYNMLQMYNTPVVKILLSKDVAKDLDPELQRSQILFLKKVKHTFLNHIQSTIQSAPLTLPEFLQLFEVIHQFKVLFDMEQYGLASLWKVILHKCINLVHMGKYEFLLFLFEWIPDMFTNEHRITCEELVEGELFDGRIRCVCNMSPLLALLYEKHQSKFELYFQRH